MAKKRRRFKAELKALWRLERFRSAAERFRGGASRGRSCCRPN